MTDAAELIVVILEQVGINRADGDTQRLRFLTKRLPVVGFVPRDVQGNARRDSGQFVDIGGIGKPFMDIPGRAGPRKDLEARAAVAVSPRWRFDVLLLQTGL